MPTAEIRKNANPTPPPGFWEEAARAYPYLRNSVPINWTHVPGRNGETRPIPMGVTCLILGGETARDKAQCRSIAFAVPRGKGVRWYGVLTTSEDPEELYGVVAYAPVADLLYATEPT